MNKLIAQTYREFRKDKGTILSAALAYYFTISIVPFLIIILWIVSFIVDGSLLQNQLNIIFQKTSIASLILGLVNQAYEEARSIAISVSLAVLLVFSLLLFSNLQTVLNLVWNVKHDKPAKFSKRAWAKHFLWDKFKSFILVFFLAFLLLPLVFSNIIISSLDFSPYIGGLSGWLLLFARYAMFFLLIGLGFFLVFRVLPHDKLDFKSNVVGAAVTSLLFMFGQFLINIYFQVFPKSTSYSFLGSLLLIVLMIYYSCIIFLIGDPRILTHCNCTSTLTSLTRTIT
mgnify:CR=1 FL=1